MVLSVVNEAIKVVFKDATLAGRCAAGISEQGLHPCPAWTAGGMPGNAAPRPPAILPTGIEHF